VLIRCQYSGTTHIKTIFSFSPGTGMRLIGNAFCSSDDSVTQLIHILHFFTINIVFYNTLKSKSGELDGQGMVTPLTIQPLGNSLSRRRERGVVSKMEYHPTGKLLPRGHDQSAILHHGQKSVTSHRRFFKK
jgi:hypothetical protein